MTTGIVDTLQRMSAVFIAVMLALPGLDFLLLQGEPATGASLLALAAVVLLVSEYVSTPGDAVGSTAGRVVGWIAKPPEDEE
jgi:hypothetical protein